MNPKEIEDLSFRIIDKEAGAHRFDERHWPVVRRMVHTSADFEYIKSVRFGTDAIDAGIAAVQSGKTVFTDTHMARSGIRKKALEDSGGRVVCLIDDPAVTARAAAGGGTRAKAAVEMAAEMAPDAVFVVGNAPTALLRIIELTGQGKLTPSLVVGLPVGFVNAAESKADLLLTDLPFITNVGRKGGSNVAAAVMNALIILADGTKQA